MCSFSPDLHPISVQTALLPSEVMPTCICISSDSQLVALGQRVALETQENSGKDYAVCIQLYSKDLKKGSRLLCDRQEELQLLKNVNFNHNSQIVTCYGTTNIFAWQWENQNWKRVKLGSVKATVRAPGMFENLPTHCLSRETTLEASHRSHTCNTDTIAI